jgi:hypothetical protein
MSEENNKTAEEKVEKTTAATPDTSKKEVKETMTEKKPELEDFYNKRDIYKVDPLDVKEYDELKDKLSEKDIELLNSGKHFYELQFENIGGLVMPLIIQVSFADGTEEIIRIPAEIWRRQNYNVSKVFIFDKVVTNFRLDPFLETADTDLSNNSWPKEVEPTRFKLFREQQTRENPMQRQKRADQLEND